MASAERALVEELFTATDRGMDPLEAIEKYFDPSVEWVDGVVTNTVVRGHAGFIEAMANLQREGYDADSTPEHYEDLSGGVVLASGYTRLTQGDSFTDLPAYWVFEVRDGKVVRGGSATRRDRAIAFVGRKPSGS